MLKLALFVSLFGLTVAKNRVLVLLDSPSYTHSHSTFFNSLKDRGYELTVKLSDSPDLILQKFNDYLYDHLIVFAPKTEEFGGMLNAKLLAKFVDSGGNVLMAAGKTNGEAIREFAAECGIKIDVSSDQLTDGSGNYLNNDVLLSNQNMVECPAIIGSTKRVIYNGGSVHFNKSNYLIIPILSADSNHYLEESNSHLLGSNIGRNINLIAAMQARNNARVTILGSADIFSNRLLFSKSNHTDNEIFSEDLVDWTFQRRGVLRLSDPRHNLVGNTEEPPFYTVRQKANFSFKLDEMKDGEWMPFCVEDLQFEFIRIDPFIRQYMKCKDGVYSSEFEVPDVHGVYKFLVRYSKPGYSHVIFSKVIPVHPLRHDQYERFIPSAMPYYVACASMLIGVFFLSFIVLYHEDVPTKKKNQ